MAPQQPLQQLVEVDLPLVRDLGDFTKVESQCLQNLQGALSQNGSQLATCLTLSVDEFHT